MGGSIFCLPYSVELKGSFQVRRANRPTALLANDEFQLVTGLPHPGFPFLHLRDVVLTPSRALNVVFITVAKHHHIGVLLDLAGLAQIGQHGALVVAAFYSAREL